MKVTDIMVGDWVMNPFQVDTCESPYAKIDSIDGERVTFLLDGFVKITGSEKDLNPIPLTSEMLESNGFERDLVEEQKYSSIMGESFRGFYKIPSIPKKYTGFCLEDWGGVYTITDHQMMRIENVHELQHALKICGIKEEIQLWS